MPLNAIEYLHCEQYCKIVQFSGFRIVADFGKFNCINKTNKCNIEDVHYLETIFFY